MQSVIKSLQRRIAVEGTADGRNIIAFSGGVDSSLVAALVHSVFPKNSLACIGISASLPASQRALARSVAQSIGIRLNEVLTKEGEDPAYTANVGQSCYHCKSHLYSALESVAMSVSDTFELSSNKQVVLFNGTNRDDKKDITRVGLKAASEYNVSSPIDSLTKSEVRLVAKELNLINWNYAASPCLRSRLEFGVEATSVRLASVEKAENIVRSYLQLSVSDNLRVRSMVNNKALIEVDEHHITSLKNMVHELNDAVLPLGFSSLDIRQFKSGSLSLQTLEKGEKY